MQFKWSNSNILLQDHRRTNVSTRSPVLIIRYWCNVTGLLIMEFSGAKFHIGLTYKTGFTRCFSIYNCSECCHAHFYERCLPLMRCKMTMWAFFPVNSLRTYTLTQGITCYSNWKTDFLRRSSFLNSRIFGMFVLEYYNWADLFSNALWVCIHHNTAVI